MSDNVVAVIDSLLGAQEEHQHLLFHGDNVNVRFLHEDERASRPWLYTSDPKDWSRLLETLLLLKPAGGAYVAQTYENLIARAEETLANFAYDHNISGEDKYVEQLLDTERTCDLSQYTSEQIRSYFTLLIVGSKVPGTTCKRSPRLCKGRGDEGEGGAGHKEHKNNEELYLYD